VLQFKVGCERGVALEAQVKILFLFLVPTPISLPTATFSLNETWSRTEGDFKAQLKKPKVKVVKHNMLEHPKLIKKLNLPIDPSIQPFFQLL